MLNPCHSHDSVLRADYNLTELSMEILGMADFNNEAHILCVCVC